MQQVAEFHEGVVVGKDFCAFMDHCAHRVKHALVLVHALKLLGHDVGGFAFDAGEDEEQMRFKFRQPLRCEWHAVNGEVPFGAEFDHVEAAVGCEHLVLAAHVVLEDVALEVDGFAGQFLGPEKFALETVQVAEGPDEARNRA